MSKELTEKYQNKELSGWYYVKTNDGHICHWLLFTDTIEFEKDIKEVLAAVPSYNEYIELMEMNKNQALTIHKLQEQLAEANEVIESLRTYDFTVDDENAEEYQVKYGIAGEKIYKNKKQPKEFERWRKKITKSFEKKLKSGV